MVLTGVPPPCCVFASAMGYNVCWVVCGQALEAINMAALQQIGDLNLRTISNIVYGCACVHFWDRRLMDALADRAVQLAGQGTGQVCIRANPTPVKLISRVLGLLGAHRVGLVCLRRIVNFCGHCPALAVGFIEG